FYLTKNGYNGTEALTACAAGYHMASLFEIRDPSNLRYNTDLGLVFHDSGFGPPANFFGWIRTRTDGPFDIPNPGQGNCDLWTVGGGGAFGTAVMLSDQWGDLTKVNVATPWLAFAEQCSLPFRVWCVQD